MQWYYESDGQPQGPVPESQLRRLLAEHKISQHHRVWREGMEDWLPLGSVSDFKANSGTAAPSPDAERTPSPAYTTDLEKKSVPFEGFNGGAGDKDEGSETDHEHALSAASVPVGEPSPTWENPSRQRGPLNYLRTAAEVLFTPGRAFRSLNHTGHWGPPLAYYLLGMALGWLCFFETAFLLANHDPNVPAKMLENFRQLPAVTFLNLLAPSILLSCMLGPILLLGTACCLHGALTMGGAARRSLATTYRLSAYILGTFGLALVFLPVGIRVAVSMGRPHLSGMWVSDMILVLWVWAFVCTLRGAAAAHDAGLLRVFVSLVILTVAAIFPPMLFLLKLAEMSAASY